MNDKRVHKFSDAEIDELVSHVLGLRKDFIQDLLRPVPETPITGVKSDLRERLLDAIDKGRIAPERLIEFLDEKEPGGKQHVFLYKVPTSVNDQWKDTATARRRLQRQGNLSDLLDARIPVAMPEELTLSSVALGDDSVEIVAVEARHYEERDDSYDRQTQTADGLSVHLKGYVERVARSTVRLRWNVKTRNANLHITQATQQSAGADFYDNVADRFGGLVTPWLDFKNFSAIDLHKAIHKIQAQEQTKAPLTRSRQGRWELPGGSQLQAASASRAASVFAEKEMVQAVGAVATPTSGQTGNVYWLPSSNTPAELDRELHIVILAADSRVHFMRPSAPEVVDHVLSEIRRLS